MSMVQMKVSGLEDKVDRMAQELAYDMRCSDPATIKLLRRSPAVASPRFSTYTPRPSVDLCRRQAPLLPTKDTEVWEEKDFIKSRSSSFSKQSLDMWMEPAAKPNKNPLGKITQRSSAQGGHCRQTRKTDNPVPRVSTSNVKQNILEIESNSWKVVKCHMLNGDLDSAYVEALCSGSELVLFHLLDRTGPVLDNLSQKTASDLLTILASYFLEQRFVNSILPWLQQVSFTNLVFPSFLLILNVHYIFL